MGTEKLERACARARPVSRGGQSVGMRRATASTSRAWCQCRQDAESTRSCGHCPCGSSSRRFAGEQRGMVTAELAVGILCAALVAGMLCWVLALIGLRITCQDAAAQVARQIARGDRQAAQRASDGVPDAEVSIETAGDDIRVTVRARASWGALGPVSVQAVAQVTAEPGTGGPDDGP